MIRFILMRLLQAVPVLFIIATLTFFMVRLAPGGPFTEEKTIPAEIQKRIEKIPPSSLGVTYGILQDKLSNLEMMPSSIQAKVNVGFGPNNRTREEMIAILSGKKDAAE